jgi:hypothetical protein
MKKAALGLITIVLASSTVAVPSPDRGFAPRVGDWANAIAGVLAANAGGYGPGYNYSPGYAFARGPDVGALAALLHTQATPFPVVAKDTVIAEARGLDDQPQPRPR